MRLRRQLANTATYDMYLALVVLLRCCLFSTAVAQCFFISVRIVTFPPTRVQSIVIFLPVFLSVCSRILTRSQQQLRWATAATIDISQKGGWLLYPLGDGVELGPHLMPVTDAQETCTRNWYQSLLPNRTSSIQYQNLVREKIHARLHVIHSRNRCQFFWYQLLVQFS